ncbi:stem-specific protein TSJT1-like [Triticum dicoccoides]|uniref:stem-specific protein TSJT1-like n=1 Tax=Triticum dicoccoides TaxID=85692 RepID=UPI00162E3009|nr:stem-specific protein TSJT1-like [Triticum dicoccoides]
MLAVFDRAVAPSPEGLRQPGDSGHGADGLAARFRESRPGAVTVDFGGGGAMAYSPHGQSPFLPRLFGVVDDIFCLLQGAIENMAVLKQQYGLSKSATELNLVIEAYRTLRDRGPYPADQVVRDFNGKFAFVLYDRSTSSVFMAADADGGVPFYWGVDSEGHLVVSDDDEVVKNACGKSFATFPKGFFFTTSGGLQSYEHPLNEVKPVPRVDSKGEVCGTTYAVDEQAKKDTAGIPRVGSAADWSSQY